MGEIFAQKFSAVVVSDGPVSPAILQFFAGPLEQSVIAVDDVARSLLALDGSSSSGPDGVHSMLLKSCYSELAIQLA